MANSAGKDTALFVDEFNLSTYCKDVSVTQTAESHDTTGMGSAARSFIVGQRTATLSFSGIWDSTQTTGSDDVLNTALGNAISATVSYCAEGSDAGDIALIMAADETSYEASNSIDDVVVFSAEMQTDLGSAGFGGRVLYNAAISSVATTNGTSVLVSTTTNGAIANLHVIANTYGGTANVVVQHSADNAAWTDLITFTQVASSTKTSESTTVTGTVNQYTRAQIVTATGTTGSVTPVVTFGRRP